jgi:hypothetical protein
MNNNKSTLQFTELTQDDIATHEDLYITTCLALHFEYLPSEYFDVYHIHAEQELQKAKQLFCKMFK